MTNKILLIIQIFCLLARDRYTQDDLNDLYVGPQFRLNYRYAQILVNFYVCWMYAISMPLMPILGALVFYVSYWVDKFLFCNFYRIPPMYGDEIGKKSTIMIGYSVIIHLLMSLWMLGNRRIFKSQTFISDADTHAFIRDSGLDQVHLIPIETILTIYILLRLMIVVLKFGGVHSLNFLKCLTCQSGGTAKELMKQKKQKYINIDFSRAVDRGMIKGLASYNILQNPK